MYTNIWRVCATHRPSSLVRLPSTYCRAKFGSHRHNRFTRSTLRAHTTYDYLCIFNMAECGRVVCVCALSVAAADDVLQIVRKYVLNYQCFIHSDPSNATHLSTAKECPAGRCTITATARWRNCIFIYLSFIAVTEQHAAVQKKMERNTPTQRARRVRVQRVTTQTYIYKTTSNRVFYVLFDKKKDQSVVNIMVWTWSPCHNERAPPVKKTRSARQRGRFGGVAKLSAYAYLWIYAYVASRR